MRELEEAEKREEEEKRLAEEAKRAAEEAERRAAEEKRLAEERRAAEAAMVVDELQGGEKIIVKRKADKGKGKEKEEEVFESAEADICWNCQTRKIACTRRR